MNETELQTGDLTLRLAKDALNAAGHLVTEVIATRQEHDGTYTFTAVEGGVTVDFFGITLLELMAFVYSKRAIMSI